VLLCGEGVVFGVVQVAFEGFGDGLAVAGGEQVTLVPVDGGTRIRWAATWDQTLAGRLVHRSLKDVYPQIVADLAAAAEKQAVRAQG
jgi:hypothetical protein